MKKIIIRKLSIHFHVAFSMRSKCSDEHISIVHRVVVPFVVVHSIPAKFAMLQLNYCTKIESLVEMIDILR